jgi:hypothetical protein
MGLLQHPAERRLSAMIGADVTFEKLNVSLLGGSVEAQGVRVAGDDPATPVVTIRRVRAEISLGAAMKKQFVVKSLTIEKPVVTIVRGADGQLNLPKRLRPHDTATSNRSASDTVRHASDNGGQDDDAGSWKLEAKKVLLVDGEAHFRDAASGYHFALEQVLGEVKEADGGLEFTLIADAAGRRDGPPAEMGQVRMHGRAEHVPDLSHWQRASVRATLEVADGFRARVEAPSVSPMEAKAELSGSIDLAVLSAFLPSGASVVELLRTRLPSGTVELTGRATYSVADGLRVPELTVRGFDLLLGAAPAI